MSGSTMVRRVLGEKGPPVSPVMLDAVPRPIYDLSTIDLHRTVVALEEIQKIIPQRHEMEQLQGIVHIDNEADVIIGRREVRPTEFWVRSQPPESAAMPPTLLLECAAQLSAYWGMVRQPEMGFVGFARCDELEVHGHVTAPSVVYMVAKVLSIKPRRLVAQCQAICAGRVVFGVKVTGMSV